MPVCGFETEARVPGSFPGGEERNTESIFGQQERTFELPPERKDIVMCSCYVNEERTRKMRETGNVTHCGGSCLRNRGRVPGLVRGGKERHTGSPFGQSERTTESLPEKDDIVMNSCFVDEERTRKIYFRTKI